MKQTFNVPLIRSAMKMSMVYTRNERTQHSLVSIVCSFNQKVKLLKKELRHVFI